VRLCIRIFVSLLAATFVWLLAPQARAAAPLCDARGAIMFAPNPTLEEPNSSVDVGQEDCDGSGADQQSYDHGRSPTAVDSASESVRALVAKSPTILPATPSDVLEDAATTFVPPSGVRSRVDRPPRA
jgi:hypothetical protein